MRVARGFAGVACIITIICIVIWLVIAFTGVGLYVNETNKLETYRERTCTVNSANIETEICDCNNNDDDFCVTTCYRAVWEVSYTPIGSSQISSTIRDVTSKYRRSQAEDRLNEHPVGSKNACWYDSEEPEEVQWNQPNPEPFFIMMIVGFCFLFVALLVLGACIAVTCGLHTWIMEQLEFT